MKTELRKELSNRTQTEELMNKQIESLRMENIAMRWMLKGKLNPNTFLVVLGPRAVTAVMVQTDEDGGVAAIYTEITRQQANEMLRGLADEQDDTVQESRYGACAKALDVLSRYGRVK